MRKVIIVSGISIILAIIAVISTILFINIYFPAIGTFSLEDYKSEIEYFSSNNNVGDVNNAYTAIKKAKDLWIEKFYKVANGKATNPLKGKIFKVEYDSKNECWHIYGEFIRITTGAVPHALIQSDGKVLAVWME